MTSLTIIIAAIAAFVATNVALGVFILIDNGTLPINFFFTTARLWQ